MDFLLEGIDPCGHWHALQCIATHFCQLHCVMPPGLPSWLCPYKCIKQVSSVLEVVLKIWARLIVYEGQSGQEAEALKIAIWYRQTARGPQLQGPKQDWERSFTFKIIITSLLLFIVLERLLGDSMYAQKEAEVNYLSDMHMFAYSRCLSCAEAIVFPLADDVNLNLWPESHTCELESTSNTSHFTVEMCNATHTAQLHL